MSLYKGNNLISGVMPNSANQSLSNLNSAGQDKFDEKVNKSGDTMTGGLKLESDITTKILKLKNSTVERTVNPSVNLYSGIAFQDKNDIMYGLVNLSKHSDSSIIAMLRAYNATSTDEVSQSNYAELNVGYNANGEIFTMAPKCSAINSILTTIGISKSFIDASTKPYFKLGNDLTVCFGYQGSSNSVDITFPITYSAANSYIALAFPRSGNAYGHVDVVSASKCHFYFNTAVSFGWVIIGY